MRISKAKTAVLGIAGMYGWACLASWGWVPGGIPLPAGALPVTPGAGAEAADGWSAPLPPDQWANANLSATHRGYPAWDAPVPAGTPIYAIRGGTAQQVRNNRCGIGVTVTDHHGARWVYCHASAHVADNGPVNAGDQLASSGSTGHSTGPHLHVEVITDRNRCPQPLLSALRSTGTGIDPHDLPATGCTH